MRLQHLDLEIEPGLRRQLHPSLRGQHHQPGFVVGGSILDRADNEDRQRGDGGERYDGGAGGMHQVDARQQGGWRLERFRAPHAPSPNAPGRGRQAASGQNM